MNVVETLGLLSSRRRDELVVGGWDTEVWDPWRRSSPGADDLVDGDAMGMATAYGLGVALARPDRRVWVLTGDGSQMMDLSSLVTVVAAEARNLVVVVFRNDVYGLTGGQPIPAAGAIDFVAVAFGCGFPCGRRFEDLASFDRDFDEVMRGDSPTLVELVIGPPGH